MNTTQCPICGKAVSGADTFCPFCGQALSNASRNEEAARYTGKKLKFIHFFTLILAAILIIPAISVVLAARGGIQKYIILIVVVAVIVMGLFLIFIPRGKR